MFDSIYITWSCRFGDRFFGKEFIAIYWVGAEYKDAYYVALLLVLPASIALIQNIGIEIQRAQNKHQFRSIVYMFMAVANLIMSIFLCQLYGAVGGAIGTAIALIVANGIIMNIYYHRHCNIDILMFWKEILRASVGMIIPFACGIMMRSWMDLSHIGYYIVSIMMYTAVYAVSMWFLGMNEFEKLLVMNPLKKVWMRHMR